MANARLAQLPTIADAVRLGVVDIEIAALGTAYNVDASYERLGTIVPGSYKPDISRDMYMVKRGLPQIATKTFAIGMTGKVAFDLSEITPRAIDVANGGQAPVVTSTSATTVAVSPTPTTTTFSVASATGYAVGNWITVVTTAGTITRKITALSGVAITVDALPVAPASGAAVNKITNIQVPGGGVQIVERTMRAIFTDSYDDQFIWHFPKVMTTGKMAFDAKDAASEAILSMEFDLFGTQSTVGGNTDYFLYHSYFVPKP